MKIVNITPHIGGGVGAVLDEYFRFSKKVDFQNSLFCLDRCSQQSISSEGFEFEDGVFWGEKNNLLKALSNCDVVLIHYWNHPLLTVFLSVFDLTQVKIVFWCHNSGLSEPHIIPNFVAELADSLVFSSRSSLEAPNIDELRSLSVGNVTVVPTVRDLKDFKNIALHRTILKSLPRLLYVGTVSKSKMHPDTARIFAAFSRQGLSVQVVGGPDHEELSREVESLGGRIHVFGPVVNVLDFFKDSDIFVYPLRSDHYGTGEQVILEALASGLPVVAFNNAAEMEILQRFRGSVLAASTDEFIDCALAMVESPKQIYRDGMKNSKMMSCVYKQNSMSKQISKVLIKTSKKKLRLKEQRLTNEVELNLVSIYARSSFFNEKVHQLILASPDQGTDIILSAIRDRIIQPGQASKWQQGTKSTPAHYMRYFPDNEPLSNLVQCVRELCD
jgi:L-malate glycosyltransferase